MKQCVGNEKNWAKQVADANRLEMDFFGKYHSGPGEYKLCVVKYATTIATITEALIDTFGLERPKQFSRYFFEAAVLAGAFAGVGYFIRAMLQFLICGGWIYWEKLRDAWGDLFSATYDWPEGGGCSFAWLPDEYAPWRLGQEGYMAGVREQTRRRSESSTFAESAEACAFLLTMQNEKAQTAMRLYAGQTLEKLITDPDQLEALHRAMSWSTRM